MALSSLTSPVALGAMPQLGNVGNDVPQDDEASGVIPEGVLLQLQRLLRLGDPSRLNELDPSDKFVFAKGNLNANLRLALAGGIERMGPQFDAVMKKLDPAVRSQLLDSLDQIRAETGLPSLKTGGTGDTDGMLSDSEIGQQIVQVIRDTQTNYLDYFEKAAKAYGEFFKDVSNLQGELSKHIKVEEDGKKVTIDPQFKDSIEQVIKKWDALPIATFDDPKVAEEWATKLGMDPAKTVHKNGDKYELRVDTSPLKQMMDDFPPGQMDMVNYDAWKKGFDAQIETIKTNVQLVTEKYSRANSMVDNMVKLLTSAISALFEASKATIAACKS